MLYTTENDRDRHSAKTGNAIRQVQDKVDSRARQARRNEGKGTSRGRPLSDKGTVVLRGGWRDRSTAAQGCKQRGGIGNSDVSQGNSNRHGLTGLDSTRGWNKTFLSERG